MQWLAQICIRRPVFATVLMLVLMVLGAVGYLSLGLDKLPNADVPIVVVTTRLPGAAPAEVEADITDRIEGAVSTISGIDELRSTSSEGISQVVLSFSLDKSADVAAQDVRDKVSTVAAELPTGAESPVVSKVDLNAAPVLLITLRGGPGVSVRDLTELADKRVRRRIESIAGVGQVALLGGRQREASVWLDPYALRAHGLTAVEVAHAIASQNLTSPGGRLEAGPRATGVQVEGRVASVEDLARVVVHERDGRSLRLEEVARVEDGEQAVHSLAQLDQDEVVVLSVRKQSGQNTVAVVDEVLARLGAVRGGLPADVKLEVVRDNSAEIRTATHAVTEHLVLGGVLAALVVLVFLGNVRSTLIAALAIPISIVGTFAVMWAMGFTLNVLTLLALALAVGIVIDDAIVVLENIVRHLDEKGEKPFVAAVLATREIGLAVLATTLSLLAVFVPVALMGGLVGRFLRSFGLTMAFAIAVSMLVSFSLTPMLAARWLRPRAAAGPRPWLERLVDRLYQPLDRGYSWVLAHALRRRWLVVLLSAGSLALCGPLAASLPGGFLPEDDQGQFEVMLRAPEGTTLHETRLMAERVATDIRRLPGVRHSLLIVGGDERETPNLARINLYLDPPEVRSLSQRQLMDQVRQYVLRRLPPEVRSSAGETQDVSSGDAGSQATQYALSGPDLGRLTELAGRLLEGLRQVPGAVDVDSTLVAPKPELLVEIDRDRAADLGVRVADVADTLRVALAGDKASTYAEGGEQYDVRVRADARFRRDEGSLDAFDVPSSRGRIPLASVVRQRSASAPGEISRLGRQRQITLLANAAPGHGDSEIEEALKNLAAREGIPQGYRFEPVGFSRETGRTMAAFLLAFGLSFVFMYLVLAAQFESWLHPITILLSLPLTVPFALLSLHLFGQSLNLFTLLGLLVLFGVVKKNAILQIDHTNALRAAGVPRERAILEANRDRLRPILMTTVAFVAGMVPLLTSKGIGSGQSRAMAGIVLGGQSLSLLLTLLAVPVFYSLFDDAAAWARRRVSHPSDPSVTGEADLDGLLDPARHLPAVTTEADVHS